MNTTINTAKIIGICHRLSIAPKSARRALIQEIIACAEEGFASADRSESESVRGELRTALTDCRAMLATEKDPTKLSDLLRIARRLKAQLYSDF